MPLISAKSAFPQEVDALTALHYQPLEQRYLDDLYTLWSDPAVIRYTGILQPCTREQARHKLLCLQQSDGFVILQQHTFVGIIGCPAIDRETEQFGLFYQLKPDFWHQGYATAAVGWMLNFMKEKYSHPILYADVITANTASEAILRHFHFICQSQSEPIHYAGTPAVIRHYKLRLREQ